MRKNFDVLSKTEKENDMKNTLKTYFTPVFTTIDFGTKDCLTASSGDGGIGWNEGWGEGHDIFG